jgi:hypothetical protein
MRLHGAVGNAPRKIAVQPTSGLAATTPVLARATAAPAGKIKSLAVGGVSYADHGTKDVRNLSRLELRPTTITSPRPSCAGSRGRS